MNARTFSTALTLTALLFSLFSCVKTEEAITPLAVDPAPSMPEGNRIRIHFGTYSQLGCMYSFSDCIWIGWGTEALNSDAHFALQFDQGDEVGQYFGQYFPLTSDYVVDATAAKALGIEPQVIPAGFYPLRDTPSGQSTGKRMVMFAPNLGQSTGNLVNPKNPQDNIGQLHNLAVQVVLHDNRDAIQSFNGDKAATQKLVTEKTIQFLAEAELPLNPTDQQRALAFNLDRDFGNYAARLDETRLSTNDKKALLVLFDEAAAIQVSSPAELGNFLKIVTEHENRLAQDTKLDNPTVVLSMVSMLKYSRYFWYWKSISSPLPGSGTTEPAGIPDWVWADIIGLEVGGPGVAIIASAIVYLDQHK